MKAVRWILIMLGSLIIAMIYLLDLIRGGSEISLGPRSYTVITFGMLLVIIGIVFFGSKKEE